MRLRPASIHHRLARVVRPLLVAFAWIATPSSVPALAPVSVLASTPSSVPALAPVSERGAVSASEWGVTPVSVSGAGQSFGDTVVIRFGADVVTITQRIPALEATVDARAIRLDDQELQVDRATRAGEILDRLELERLSGAYRLRISGSGPVDLRYRVTGRLDRIPLFVSSPESQLASGFLTLRVELASGSSSGLDLTTSLPRFRRGSEGVLLATLSSPPAFIRLDEADGLSFARAADLAVVLLIFLAAAWAWRTARRSSVLTRAAVPTSRDGDVP